MGMNTTTLPKKGLKTRLYNIGMEKKGLKKYDYNIDMEKKDLKKLTTQALHGLAPKCKLINMHELISKSTNDYVTLLPCENGANVNNKG